MVGLTPLGVVHTAISIVAVIAGCHRARARQAHLEQQRIGQGVRDHHRPHLPHRLRHLPARRLRQAARAWASSRSSCSRPHGAPAATAGSAGASRYVETVGYSATFLFHLIPAITETTTRLPLGRIRCSPVRRRRSCKPRARCCSCCSCWARGSRSARCARRDDMTAAPMPAARFRDRIQGAIDRGRRRDAQRDGRRQRPDRRPDPRLRRNVRDVAAVGAPAGAAVHGHRARSSGHRRLVDSRRAAST